MTCEAGNNCSIPSLSVLLNDGTKYSGMISGNSHSLYEYRNIVLSNSVALKDGLVVSNSTRNSSKEILEKMTGLKNVNSICLGWKDDDLVVLTSVSELQTVNEPLRFIQL